MARNTENAETVETPATTEAPATTAPAAAETASTDSRHKKLTLTEKYAPLYGGNVGDVVNRVDYIRKRWKDKVSRSDITKEVNDLAGVKVPYQIIFAATKGQEGGPDKSAAPETPPAA